MKTSIRSIECVAEDEIRGSIAIEIADALADVIARNFVGEHGARFARETVHQPRGDLPRLRIVKEHIGDRIVVEAIGVIRDELAARHRE